MPSGVTFPVRSRRFWRGIRTLWNMANLCREKGGLTSCKSHKSMSHASWAFLLSLRAAEGNITPTDKVHV